MITIFNYHSIDDRDYKHAVSPADFERQMHYLSRKRCLSLKQLQTVLLDRQQGEYVHVTFDDGFLDNIVTALPIIKKYNIPVTIFVTTDYVDGKSETPDSYVNWDQLRTLAAESLVSIQSHTCSHVRLDQADSQRVRRELQQSAHKLGQELTYSPIAIAYPKSRYLPETVSVAKEFYQLGFGGSGVITDFSRVNLLALPRVTVTKELPLWKIQLLTSRWYVPLQRLRRLFG